MKYDVFISYSSVDKTIADAVCQALENNGFLCWMAPRDVRPGIRYAQAIMNGIRESHMMVLVYSENTNESDHVASEVEKAFNFHKTIIPFLVDNTPMNDELGYFLTRTQWLEAFPHYEKKIGQLVYAVSNVLNGEIVSSQERIDAEKIRQREEDACRKVEEETKRKEEERKKAELQQRVEETGHKKEEEKRKAEERRIAEEKRMAEEKKWHEEEACRKAEIKRWSEEKKRREEERRLVELRRIASERQREIQRLDKEKWRTKERRKEAFKTIILVIFAPIWFPVSIVIEYWREICNVLLGIIGILLFVILILWMFLGISPKKMLSNPKEILSKPASLTTSVIKKENGDIEITIGNLPFLMKHVEGGTFTMGCTPEQGEECEERELPAHQVTLNGFYMGETEVTQALWKLVMEDTRWKKLKGKNPSHFENDEHPVDYVSGDCMIFIHKLNEITGLKFRLPTEAEWEYAARGGKRSRGYKYSGSDNIDEVAWYSENSDHTTHPVKTKKPNEIGLYDMSGNVNEWCQDYYRKDYYGESPSINPKGPKSGEFGNAHVIRGGGWRNTSVVCRVSDRDGYRGFKDETFGFRLVLEQ